MRSDSRHEKTTGPARETANSGHRPVTPPGPTAPRGARRTTLSDETPNAATPGVDDIAEAVALLERGIEDRLRALDSEEARAELRRAVAYVIRSATEPD